MGKISKAGKRQKSLKIGIFGGAFNPVHNGHINLAEEYISLLGLDRLFVVPTANPPHRAYDDFVPAECRFDMLSLAFGDNKTVEISDIEFQSSQKSYTYNTVLKFKEMLGECELFLIVGQDQFLSFDKWYNYEALLKEVTLCTAAREKNSREKIIDFAQNTLHLDKYYLTDFEPVVVSSSYVREKIANGESLAGLVPESVENYIKSKGLYNAKR